MKILVVNDDGYDAPGLKRLAGMASRFGEVTVAAPEFHSSAKSHSITLKTEMKIKPQDIGLEGVTAYSVAGTPADCIRLALYHILPAYPDVVFSGINDGANTGFDVAYSGTIAAAMEALMHGIPAIAFSKKRNGLDEVTEAYLPQIMELLLKQDPGPGRIWNVNFPGCPLRECKGVLWNRPVAKGVLYQDCYGLRQEEDGCMTAWEILKEIPPETIPRNSDIAAVHDGYVSVGTVRSMVLG